MNLPTKIAYFLYHGLALATRSTYDSHVRSYMEACRMAGLQHRDGSLFPAQLLWIENWVVELAGRVKSKNIKKRVASLRSYHIDLGYDTRVFADEQLARVIRGVMRLYPDTTLPRERTPITREILVQLLSQLDLQTRRGALLAAAFTLAFAAFLRSGEFTYKEEDLRDESFADWFVTRASVRFDPEGKSHHGGDRFCPVRMMANYFWVCPPGSMREPLFSREGHIPFTREYLVQELQGMASTVGMKGNFTGHSFRRGAATWARLNGLSDEQIQQLGRWKSDAYKLYIDSPHIDKLALSQTFLGYYPLPTFANP